MVVVVVSGPSAPTNGTITNQCHIQRRMAGFWDAPKSLGLKGNKYVAFKVFVFFKGGSVKLGSDFLVPKILESFCCFIKRGRFFLKKGVEAEFRNSIV